MRISCFLVFTALLSLIRVVVYNKKSPLILCSECFPFYIFLFFSFFSDCVLSFIRKTMNCLGNSVVAMRMAPFTSLPSNTRSERKRCCWCYCWSIFSSNNFSDTVRRLFSILPFYIVWCVVNICFPCSSITQSHRSISQNQKYTRSITCCSISSSHFLLLLLCSFATSPLFSSFRSFLILACAMLVCSRCWSASWEKKYNNIYGSSSLIKSAYAQTCCNAISNKQWADEKGERERRKQTKI